MDRNRCPACGAPGYRGKRCGSCLYAPFSEEIAHRNHYHAGEPLVTGVRPSPTVPGRGCSSYPGKRTRSFSGAGLLLKLLGVAAAVLVAAFVPGGVLLVIIAAMVIKPFTKKN